MIKNYKSCIALFLIISTLLGGAFYFYHSKKKKRDPSFTSYPKRESDEKMRARALRQNADASRALRFDQSSATLANDPLDRSQLSDYALVLDDPDADESDVKGALYQILSTIRFLGTEKSYPAGLNVEVTNALLGVNSRKVGYLPMDSLRINENGELVDEYDTPYWFHGGSSGNLTITSAGADKQMHTEDDVAYPKN